MRLQSWFKPLLLTCLAMVAFAANSVLCRMALGGGLIDPASFTAVRLGSGVLFLFLILFLRERATLARPCWDLRAAMALFAYAACFSFAYLDLSTGTGALILFGCVQLGLVAAGLMQGERPGWLAWTGMLLATLGLVYLVSPGLEAPSPAGAALMAVAGFSWAVYTLRGRGARLPLVATAWNFLATLPAALVLLLLYWPSAAWTSEGLLLAVLSGALASGLGYVIWYAALRHHSAVSAALVQLSVPLLAAWGGLMFMGEPFTNRLLVAAIAILGGLALYFSSKAARPN
ncbi:MAG TPA: DMT family transporter [Xanthomonadales bacterium]|nr:DMT family transporter [Xanthomonadales bacterium]